MQIILEGNLNCPLTPLDKAGGTSIERKRSVITSPSFSDHSAVSFVLQSKEYAKRGPGCWKINNSLLKDDNFTAELAAKIPEYKAKHNYLTDKGLYWDMLKMEVRGFCV